MAQCQFSNVTCFNPFKKSNHTIRDKKKLRKVTNWICDLYPDLPKHAKVCDYCRKELAKLKDQSTSTHQEEEISDSEDPSFSAESHVIATLNSSLYELGESPIDRKKIKSKQYASKKVKTIDSALKRNLFVSAKESSESDNAEDLDKTVLQNLIENFSNTTSRTKKLMILTCLPESWGIRKIMREFNAPNYMVRQSKKLLKEKGILETPNSKPGKNLSTEIVNTVTLFYESDEISRSMPGIKDCISITDQSGNKVKVYKRLILCNLKEAHVLFKEKFPDLKISFSKFAELRPKRCILAGSKGTHTVCVCTTHQNVKLMIENVKMGAITNGELPTYKHCISKMLCNPPSIDCNMSECSSCPGDFEIRNILEKSFEDNLIEKVTFRQWVSVDRCNLETLQKSSAEFIEYFCDKLSTLVRHDFIARQQSSFMNQVKENLKESEFAVVLDFSENYSMVIQDEAQSYHWANEQATIHPFVVYYKRENKVEHLNYVVISDCLEHNTVAVYTFQKKFIKFLENKFQKAPTKIFYFSDGCAAQYKNKKNFSNLCFHKEDFNIEAEWHFSATAHGKGPCDGLGGTIKRQAARASLQRPYENQIVTPLQLHKWAKSNFSSKITFAFSTQEDYINSEIFLKDRFNKAVTIKGTQQYHAFIPDKLNTSDIFVKSFSDSSKSFKVIVSKSDDKLSLSDCNGYITAAYDKHWWLAYILDKDEELDELKVTFLHPHGPSSSFSYPSKPDVLWVPLMDVLCSVEPLTPTGRTYVLTKKDILKSNNSLSKVIQ